MPGAIMLFALAIANLILLHGAWTNYTRDSGNDLPNITTSGTITETARLIAYDMLMMHENTMAACTYSTRSANPQYCAENETEAFPATTSAIPQDDAQTPQMIREFRNKNFNGLGQIETATMNTTIVSTGPNATDSFTHQYVFTYFAPKSGLNTQAAQFTCSLVADYLDEITQQSRKIGYFAATDEVITSSAKSYQSDTTPANEQTFTTSAALTGAAQSNTYHCPVIVEQLDY